MKRRVLVFARLHGRGLVYGDPSPHNILFSSDGDHSRPFLIDADNLHVQGDPNAAGVFTPGYGAPELISGHADPDTLTDAFAPAVIAFELLTLAHPFVGDLVHDGEPELEEAAFHGQMPWIEHSSDSSNRCSGGIPRDLVVSQEAKKVFKRMFEDGLKERLLRPGMGEWVGVFCQWADVTVACPHCSASYFAPSTRQCPWCSQPRPEMSLAIFQIWDPEITPTAGGPPGDFVTTPSGPRRSLATMVLGAKEPVQILRRHVLSDIPVDQTEESLVEATRTRDDGFRVPNLTKEPSLCSNTPRRTEPPAHSQREPKSSFPSPRRHLIGTCISARWINSTAPLASNPCPICPRINTTTCGFQKTAPTAPEWFLDVFACPGKSGTTTDITPPGNRISGCGCCPLAGNARAVPWR